MSLSRVDYRERQVLRRHDLADDQAYHIAMRRRHNTGAHGWGIVAGLQIEARPGGFAITPGLAIDGFGRELVVPASVLVPSDTWVPPDMPSGETALADVWLIYASSTETPIMRGRWVTGGEAQSRLREEVQILLTPAVAGQEIDPRSPAAVADADLGFSAAGDPPDTPARRWPIYLGRVRSDGTLFDLRLPFAALVGERIEAPQVRTSSLRAALLSSEAAAPTDTRAAILVGADLAGDRRRFAVSVGLGAGELRDRLILERDAKAHIYGPAAVYDAVLHVGDSSLGFAIEDVRDSSALVRRLLRHADAVATRIFSQLNPTLRARLSATRLPPERTLVADLLGEINSLLAREYPAVPPQLFSEASHWPYGAAGADVAELDALVRQLRAAGDERLRYLRSALAPALLASVDDPSIDTSAAGAAARRTQLAVEINRMIARMLVRLAPELFLAEGEQVPTWRFTPDQLRSPQMLIKLLAGARNGDPPALYYLYWLLPEAQRTALQAYQEGGDAQSLLVGLVNIINDLFDLVRARSHEVLATALVKPGATTELKDLEALYADLRAQRGPLAEYLRGRLRSDTLAWVDRLTFAQASVSQQEELTHEIIALVERLAQPAALTARDLVTLYLGDERYGLFGHRLGGEDLLILGRLEIERTFRQLFAARPFSSVELLPLGTPAVATPRSIYRTAVQSEDGSTATELRIELENPGGDGDPAAHTLVIGTCVDPREGFRACLSVGADNSVTFFGEVLVEGQIIESPIGADMEDERFVANQTALDLATDVDTTSVSVSVSAVAVSGKELSYTLRLQNTSPAQITNFEVYETIIERGQTTHLSGQIDIGSSVLPGSTVAGSPPTTEVPAGGTGGGVPTIAAPAENERTVQRRVSLNLDSQDSRSFLIITAVGINAALNLVYGTVNLPLVSVRII